MARVGGSGMIRAATAGPLFTFPPDHRCARRRRANPAHVVDLAEAVGELDGLVGEDGEAVVAKRIFLNMITHLISFIKIIPYSSGGFKWSGTSTMSISRGFKKDHFIPT